MPLRKVFYAGMCALAVSLSGCGDDNNNDAPDETAGPLSTPTPTPTPGPQQAWNYTIYTEYSDMIDDLHDCDRPYKLKIERDGDYRAGPCTTGGTDYTRGKITNDERMELDQRARAVAAQNLSDQTCTQGSAIAGSNTELSTSRRTVVVYRNDPDRYCYRGTEASAKDLHYYLGSLSAKYYPKKNP